MTHLTRGSRTSISLAAAIALALAAATGCTQQHPETTVASAEQKDPQSLYVRLGGEPAIRKVVDAFMVKLAADDRVSKRFANSSPALKEKIVLQICELSGGPQVYTGKDMKSAHRGMNITGAEWDAFVEDLVKTLDDLKVPEEAKQELLVKFGPMKTDVVGQ